MVEPSSPSPEQPLDPEALPSVPFLIRASLGAVLVAALLGVTVVLPAEEGIDPTGVGGWLGLTQIGELKNPDEVAPAKPEAAPEYAFRSDELTVTLGPREGLEVKASMRAGDELVYAWQTDGGAVFFDFHGEPKGAAKDVFTSHEKGQATDFEGAFEAPFEGVHGWYWKNLRSQPTTVTLKTSGVYRDLAPLP